MRSVQWVTPNGSGMHHVAETLARAELACGVESRCLDPHDALQDGWDFARAADVHVNHTHLPDEFQGKPHVFVHHGTPEIVFELAVRDAEQNGYNTGTGMAQHFRLMQEADAIVTFWERHHALIDLMTDKATKVDLLPMGVDHAFWSGGTSHGHYLGKPALLNCENAYPFKWSVDFLRVWRWVWDKIPGATLHVANVPANLLPQIKLMTARSGAVYGTVAGSWTYDANNLRNIFKQVDFYLSTVRYGDHNRMSMEAGASGLKVISYPGNLYADYWMREGDIRETIKDLISILDGTTPPRADKLPVPTEADMAHGMIHVYQRILGQPLTDFAVGEIPDALDVTLRDAMLSATGAGLNEVSPSANRPPALTPAQITSMICSQADATAGQVATLLGSEASAVAVLKPPAGDTFAVPVGV